MQTRLPGRAAAPSHDTTMNTRTQQHNEQGGTTTLVGMDLHSEKVQLCITEWRHGSDPVPVRSLATTVRALEGTYRRLVPSGALTVMEASTNSFDVARRLAALGFQAKVLRSDIAVGLSGPDRVNDRIDALNIAVAYARRGAGAEVHVPSPEYQEYRDIWFGYRNATKDTVRIRNRIWSFCGEHGIELPPQARARRPERIRERIARLGWSPEQSFQLENMLLALEFAETMQGRCRARIEQIVAGDGPMRRAMTVLGVGPLVAFALAAFVEDIGRFATPKKLVRYIGLNPSVCDSGKAEGRHGLAHRGRGDLRALLVESANTALEHGREPMHRWARRKVASGKPRNVVVCALARKLAVALWHALMGHPVPCREPQPCFERKLLALARHIGAEGLRAMGHATTADYVKAVAEPIYAHLPEKEAENKEEKQKPA